MAQTEIDRRVMSLPDLLEEENQLRTLIEVPPRNIRLVSIAGPNGSGKSSIVQCLGLLLPKARDISLIQRGDDLEQDTRVASAIDLEITTFREPTPLFSIRNRYVFDGLTDTPDSYRASVMKPGNTSLDAFALFTQGRRRIQEWLIKHPTTQSQLCVLDRSSEATMVHQILLNSDQTMAEYLGDTLRQLHQDGYFLPYQQTFLVIPPIMKLRDQDDDPHTNLGEIEAYKRVVRGGLLDDYCQQTFWVENDPRGTSNYLALPTLAIAATIFASQFYGKLEAGAEYKLFHPLWGACHYLIAERYFSVAEFYFSSLMKELEDNWVESGNLSIKYDRKIQSVMLRVNDRQPK